MWMLSDGEGALGVAERVDLIDQFARLSPGGEVVFTGGEPFRKKDELVSLVHACRAHGLRSSTNTNGSYLTPDSFDEILCHGPTFLVFSLDSHDPAIHDYHRGMPGSFQTTVGTITGLLARRRELQPQVPIEILTNTVVTGDNVAELATTLAFIEALGVDGMTLQILSPTFYRRGPTDVFYERHFSRDIPLAVDTLQGFIRNRRIHPRLRTTDTDLNWMQKYIAHRELLDEPVCGSHERNMMIDHRGDVQLCFNMKKLLGGRMLGNVRRESLNAIWSGEASASARSVMANCRQTCGMLNCHRKTSSRSESRQ
jgi:radical SAM protein with 4Fe4S-binding SPASM domain